METFTRAGQRYSYGSRQRHVIDTLLITQSLSAKLRGFQYARNDADFPETLRNVATRPERTSDHDMPVAFFRYPQADVALAKSASTVAAGGTVTYTLAATNAGPDLAETVRVQDVLPASSRSGVSAPGGVVHHAPRRAGGTV